MGQARTVREGGNFRLFFEQLLRDVQQHRAAYEAALKGTKDLLAADAEAGTRHKTEGWVIPSGGGVCPKFAVIYLIHDKTVELVAPIPR